MTRPLQTAGIQTDPQYVDLSIQRCETLLRMGDYERVIAEAQECLKSWPDRPVFQYHLFCCPDGPGGLRHRPRRCSGRSFNPRPPRGTSFGSGPPSTSSTRWRRDGPGIRRTASPRGGLPADGGGRGDLSRLSRPRPAGSSRMDSAPNGRRMARSWPSAWACRATAAWRSIDPATKETDLLIVPGKDPRWSPDGRYIAFVRDRQASAAGGVRHGGTQETGTWLEGTKRSGS